MDKFAVAKNENRDSEEYYVVHLLNPVIIFHVKKETNLGKDSDHSLLFDGVLFQFDLWFADTTFPGFRPDKVNSTRKRAFRWFRSFLERKNL